MEREVTEASAAGGGVPPEVAARARAGYQEGAVSVVVNLALFGLKMWAGLASHSLAIVADAWHTLTDSISSLIVIAGSRLAARKPDAKHPFGYGRWESVASIVIAMLLVVVAWDFLLDAWHRLQSRDTADFGVVAIAVTVVGIVVKECLAQYAFRLGRRSGNVAVKADGWHHRSDALSSVVVLAGILVSRWFWWIDAALGAVVAVMLCHAAYEIVREAIEKILGEEPSAELTGAIANEAEQLTGRQLHIHHFHLHNYVSHQEMTFHVRLPDEMTIGEAHHIASAIEQMVRERHNIESTVHLEPLGERSAWHEDCHPHEQPKD